jgi:hypothetical protein
LGALPIPPLDRGTFGPMLAAIERALWREGHAIADGEAMVAEAAD